MFLLWISWRDGGLLKSFKYCPQVRGRTYPGLVGMEKETPVSKQEGDLYPHRISHTWPARLSCGLVVSLACSQCVQSVLGTPSFLLVSSQHTLMGLGLGPL